MKSCSTSSVVVRQLRFAMLWLGPCLAQVDGSSSSFVTQSRLSAGGGSLEKEPESRLACPPQSQDFKFKELLQLLYLSEKLKVLLVSYRTTSVG